MQTSPQELDLSGESTETLYGRLQVHLPQWEYHEQWAAALIAELKRRLPPDAPLLEQIEKATRH